MDLRAQAEKALIKIKQYGSSMIVRRYDQVMDAEGIMQDVVIDTPVHGLRTTPKVEEYGREAIQVGDVVMLVSAVELPSAPHTSDVLVLGERQMDIISIIAVQPGDIPVMYKIQVRSA